MNPTEQAVDAALREAYENGFRAGREEAARVCDELADYHGKWACVEEWSMYYERAYRGVSTRIRALKSKEPQQ